jgi:O-antigen/teichoic acid export membrane protein
MTAACVSSTAKAQPEALLLRPKDMSSLYSFTKIKRSAIFKDSVWVLIGDVIGKGLALTAGIVVARFLGKELYGEYGMIKNTLIQIAVFSTFGLGYAITRYVSHYKDKFPEYIRQLIRYSVRTTFATSGVIALLVLVFAKELSLFLEAPHLEKILRLSIFAILFNAIVTIQTGILAGLKAFKAIAINNGFSGFITFVLSIIMTYLYGLNGSVLALVVSLLFNCVINYVSVQKRMKYYPKAINVNKQLNKEVLHFSFPIALQESSYALVHWAISFIIIKLSDYGELGIYNAATQWGALISFIPAILGSIMLSYFSGNANDINKNTKLVNAMLLTSFFTTFIPFLIVFVFSGFICSFYGESFASMNTLLNVVIFTAVITALVSVYNREMMAKGKNWFLFFSRFMRDLLVIVISIILIYCCPDRSSALLFAIATLFIYIGYLILLHIIYRKKLI